MKMLRFLEEVEEMRVGYWALLASVPLSERGRALMEKHDFIRILPDPTYRCTTSISKMHWSSALSCHHHAVVIAETEGGYYGFCEKHRLAFGIEPVAEEIIDERKERSAFLDAFASLFWKTGS